VIRTRLLATLQPDMTENPEKAPFVSSHHWNPERIHAVAFYCSDGRWGEAFDEFCHESLKLPRYDRFAVPGGPLWVVMRDASLIIPQAAAREQLQFLVHAHQLERILIFGHYGCAYYAQLMGQDAEACLPAQEADLHVAARMLTGWFSGIEIQAFMAMRNEERLWFRPVPLSP
jgi:hypothetical protein